MFYIYIIFNPTVDKYYVGYSKDPWQRLIQHNSEDKRKFTGKYSSWRLKAVFEVSEIEAEAVSLERFIKKQKSRRLLEKLIDPDFEPEEKLSQLIRVPHMRD